MRYEKIVDAIVHGFFPVSELSLLARHRDPRNDGCHSRQAPRQNQRIAEVMRCPCLSAVIWGHLQSAGGAISSKDSGSRLQSADGIGLNSRGSFARQRTLSSS